MGRVAHLDAGPPAELRIRDPVDQATTIRSDEPGLRASYYIPIASFVARAA